MIKAVVTPDVFSAWLDTAGTGAKIEYFRGVLTNAIQAPVECQRDRQVRVVAARARAAERAGLILLVQKRYGEGDYGYIAVRRRDRHTRAQHAKRIEVTA